MSNFVLAHLSDLARAQCAADGAVGLVDLSDVVPVVDPGAFEIAVELRDNAGCVLAGLKHFDPARRRDISHDQHLFIVEGGQLRMEPEPDLLCKATS